MARIGEPQKEIVVDPIKLPDRKPQEAPAPKEPVKVPAK